MNIAYFSCSTLNIKFKIWTPKQYPQRHQNFVIIQLSSKEYSKLGQRPYLIPLSHITQSTLLIIGLVANVFVYNHSNKCSLSHYIPTFCSIALVQSPSTDSNICPNLLSYYPYTSSKILGSTPTANDKIHVGLETLKSQTNLNKKVPS